MLKATTPLSVGEGMMDLHLESISDNDFKNVEINTAALARNEFHSRKYKTGSILGDELR